MLLGINLSTLAEYVVLFLMKGVVQLGVDESH